MTTGESSQANSQTQAPQTSQGHRKGRSGRGRGQNHNRQGPRNSENPGPQQPSSEAAPPSEGTSSGRNQRPRRGGRLQEGRGAANSGPPRPQGHRSFGGHLTTDSNENDVPSASVPSLSANAPEFVPGKPVPARRRQQAAARSQQHSRPPKSTAQDLGTRIHEDISNRNYECTICTDDVLRSSSVWSCTLCWNVVHLKCVKKWYENQRKQDELQSAQPQREASWRCPGCNSKLIDEPGTYHCWCGKDIQPKPASAALPPHSCGQTCSKPRATCPHPCSLQCHAGPCPPCNLMGPEQSCFCSKNASRKLCRETDYENGWSCHEVCGDLLPCGEHFCSKLCHAGLCGDCEEPVESRCFCGRVEKQMACCAREEVQESFSPEKEFWFEGSFNCHQLCARKYDCGIHQCSQTCHAQDELPAHCPFSPDSVNHCPCGKTSLDELLQQPRQSCEDDVPHCEKPCEKLLVCGHLCQAKCHTGDCGTCDQKIDITCRCGRTVSRSICHQGDLQHPQCRRICQANLSCGRHKCGEHCCPGEKKAAERLASKKKHKISSQLSTVEAEHICIKTCGRPLKCGSHNCQQICHRGPCGSCPEAIFHEISCSCGKTVLHPPQPCGTRAPDCRFNCLKRPDCGHPPVVHNCHQDDIRCPRCPFLVDKMCVCGKERLHSQPCHLQEPRCGRPCGKKLKCGIHNCKKLCHKAGECEGEGEAGIHCSQTCGKTKIFCDHPCQNTCHGQTPKTAVSCPCGQHKQDVKCLVSSSNPSPTRPELKCDDECLRLERNRRLAAALNIDADSHQDDHVPYADITLRLFRDNTSWAEVQEREFRVFSKSPNEVRMRYKPMPSSQRQFLHVLAEDYGLESISEDLEPHRHVVVYKGPRFVSAPAKTLGQCVKIRDKLAAAAASAASSKPPSRPSSAMNLDPFNGLLLISPRFGLTSEEAYEVLGDDLASESSLHFSIHFLSTEEVLIRASAPYSAFLSSSATEQALARLKNRIADTVRRTNLAGNVILCHAGSGDHISRRDNLSKTTDASGWSAVAGRAAAKKEVPPGSEEPASARGTGRKLLGLKKKKVDKSSEKAAWTAQLDDSVEC